MDARQITKMIVSTAVSVGAYRISRDVIDTNTPEADSRTDQVLHTAGSMAVGGIVANAASEHTDNAVDRLFDTFKKSKNSDK